MRLWYLCVINDTNINNLNTAQEVLNATHRGITDQEESGAGE